MCDVLMVNNWGDNPNLREYYFQKYLNHNKINTYMIPSEGPKVAIWTVVVRASVSFVDAKSLARDSLSCTSNSTPPRAR